MSGAPAFGAVHSKERALNDPRGVLEEFVRSCDGFRGARDETVSMGLDPESRRKAYREKQEERGMCRSCKQSTKPGRRYCVAHLAKANERAVRSKRAALTKGDSPMTRYVYRCSKCHEVAFSWDKRADLVHGSSPGEPDALCGGQLKYEGPTTSCGYRHVADHARDTRKLRAENDRLRAVADAARALPLVRRGNEWRIRNQDLRVLRDALGRCTTSAKPGDP